MGTPSGTKVWFYPANLTRTGSTLFVAGTDQAHPGTFTCAIEAVRQNHVVGAVPVTIQILPTGTKTAVTTYDFSAAANARTVPALPTTGTLLNNIGQLARPVSPTFVRRCREALHAGHRGRTHAAQMQIWLGEYVLSHDRQPEKARQYFCQAQRLLAKSDFLYGLAAYDNALALFYEGAYGAAKDAFLALLRRHSGMQGFDRKTCVLWSRMAISCWGYHLQRSAMGIPEPPRLDPLCAAAALATCVRDLHGAYDRKTILRACPVTGEGSQMTDVLAAADRLGYSARVITCDEEGLKALPKPLVAYVEHDHFIAVVDADDQGVTYLCSDCGTWPGGRVHLTWKQWRALEATLFVSVRRPGDMWDRALQYQEFGRSDEINDIRLARGGAPGGEARLAALAHAGLGGHFKFKTDAPTNVFCGTQPTSPAGPPTGCPAQDGDPVSLASGEEHYGPVGQLTVYNPHGPSIFWSCSYRSLRGPGQSVAPCPAEAYDFTYEDYDFGVGWTQPYNIGVYDPTGGTTGTRYFFKPDGIRVSFTAATVPTAANPKVLCSVQAGIGLQVEWDYDSTGSTGHYVITDPSRTQYVTTAYNPAVSCYLLSQIIDRNGHTLRFVYQTPAHTNGWPLLYYIVNDTGTVLLRIARAQDGTGNITHVDDAYGRSIYYHCGNYYVGMGKPYPQSFQEVDHISQIVPTSQIAPNNYVYSYLAWRRVEDQFVWQVPLLHTLTVPSPSGSGTSTTTINYADTALVASMVDGNGNTRTYASTDASGNLLYPSPYTTVTVSTASGKMDYSYIVGFNGSMLETSRTNGANKLLSNATYADPNTPYEPSAVTDGNGKTTQFSYDTFGNTLQAISPRGTITRNTFVYTNFALGELQSTQQGSKTPTTFTYYEPGGLVKSVTAPLPGTSGTGATVTSTFTYDQFGNVLTAVTPGNNAANSITTTFNYIADGNYTVPFPSIGQPLTVTDNLGHTTHFRYDQQANVKSTIDALDNETDATYNVANQVLTTTFPATRQSGSGRAYVSNSYLYPGGALLSTRAYDESGAKIRQVNYGLGQESETLSTTAVGPNGSTTLSSQTYDSLYRLKTIADGNGHATTYQYNAAGYLASVSYPNSNGTYDTVQYPSYDPIGNVLKRIDGRGLVTTYLYTDPDNLLTDVQYPGSPALNIHLEYDAYARREQMTDGAGNTIYDYDDGDRPLSTETTYTGLPSQTIAYGYYHDGSQQTMTTPAGTFTYDYDAAQRPVSLTNPHSETSSWSYLDNNWLATQSLANGATTTYSYNTRGQLIDLINRAGIVPSATVLSHFGSMTYDGVGNRTSVTVAIPQIPAYGGQTTYTYDYKSQLVQEQSTRNGGYNNLFHYDAAGNPITFRGVAFAYNADNQNSANTYDGNGNPSIYKGVTLAFDPENRMTAYGTAMTAGYTGDGLRAWKKTTAGTTYFLYDGITPVCELDANSNVVATNTSGPNGLLARNSGGTSIFYTFDPQGGTAQRLDISGNIQSTNVIDAFGSIGSSATTTDPYNGYGAQWGYRNDFESSTQILGYRYYDANVGHFVTRDPIGYNGGINLYAYVMNNPLKYVDRYGYCPQLLASASTGVVWTIQRQMQLGSQDEVHNEDIGATLNQLFTMEQWDYAISKQGLTDYQLFLEGEAKGSLKSIPYLGSILPIQASPGLESLGMTVGEVLATPVWAAAGAAAGPKFVNFFRGLLP